MARAFSLAALLRLRHVQQDQAASDLAAAHARERENSSRQLGARSALSSTRSAATTSAHLYAMAAARASSRSMLADLDALGRDNEAAVKSAQAVFDAARAQSVRLEKLENRHTAGVKAEELHAEQTVLDEIASTGWHRGRDGSHR